MEYEYKFINPNKKKGEFKDDIQDWLVIYEIPNGTEWRFVAKINDSLLFERVVDETLKEQLIKEIEEMKKPTTTIGYSNPTKEEVRDVESINLEGKGYNQAIEDIIKLLKT